jgi:glycosyltransferase involved in cell wall biosynthesis
MANDYFVFIPAYNVAGTLASVLEKISDEVWNKSVVLIIDDGSTDETRSVFENFVTSLSEERMFRLRYMRFEQNSGYGAVVKKGLAEGVRSGAKYVACLHGDGQYPAERLGEFFDYLETINNVDVTDERKFALVQGSRHLTRGGAKAGNMPLYKRLGGAFLTAIENFAFYQKLTDRHSGFIVYDSEFLTALELDKLSTSFDIDLEIISIADSLGYKLAELPIPTRYADEKSNLNVVTYGLRVLRQVFRRLVNRLTA